MGIPSTVENLNVAHPTLGKPSSIEAAGSKGSGLSGIFPIKVEGILTFIGEIHQLRDRTLHAIGHLMLPNSGQDFRIAKLLILVLIEGAQSVELSSAICRGDAARIVQIQNGISLTAQQDALMI